MTEETQEVANFREALTISQLEELANLGLGGATKAFLNGGAGSGKALLRNLEGWSDIQLLPRTLSNVRDVSTSLRIGQIDLKAPIGMAPIGALGSLHPQAEDALFFAGNQTEFLPIVASHSSKKLEKISIPDSAGWWFQLYLHTERQASRRLLDKAVSRGASAIVFTVDLPVVGYRDSSRQFFNKSGKNLLPGQANSEYPSLGKVTKAPDQEEHLRLWDRVLDPSINVADLSWVIEKSGLPTYVKGVMREEEAETYLKMGAAGIIVSNHGGRALESAPSTASRVELVRSALGPQATILVDGGIRRGDDVAKALCLGADMVLVGRPYAWGLAAGGALGLQRSLEILWAELRVTMAFLGARTLGDLNRKLIA